MANPCLYFCLQGQVCGINASITVLMVSVNVHAIALMMAPLEAPLEAPMEASMEAAAEWNYTLPCFGPLY